MKNTLDMAFATVVFMAVGCSFAYGTDVAGLGFIGFPDLFLSHTDLSNGYTSGAYILFQLVFAGATATIVSGGMAERTKFSSYILYSITICAFVYPVVCHWVWSGDGWLFNMGYVDLQDRRRSIWSEVSQPFSEHSSSDHVSESTRRTERRWQCRVIT
jgi:Amt family ammonium transporter